MFKGQKTGDLEKQLRRPDAELAEYLVENRDALADSERPFTVYMREMIRAKGLQQQDVFLQAGVPERYGYKLISGEKHTLRRDVILRLTIAAGFDLDETQRALKLYGLAPLYARDARDAAIIIAVNKAFRSVERTDEHLERYGFERLAACGEEE